MAGIPISMISVGPERRAGDSGLGSMSEQHSFKQRIELPVEFVPQRVVSLAPSITETLFDLDLGERL
jgi:ABC-type Fe3+-hydroxamate transport system substrate-binding protein